MDNAAGTALIAKIWNEIRQVEFDREERAAKENPKLYRDSTVMERGKGTQFHFWSVKGLPKGKGIAFCYSQHRNVAGFYLTWTEVWSGKSGYRTNIHGHDTKRDARDYCLARLADSKKPNAERKFVLPPFTMRRGKQ